MLMDNAISRRLPAHRVEAVPPLAKPGRPTKGQDGKASDRRDYGETAAYLGWFKQLLATSLPASEDVEADARAINAEPWEPLAHERERRDGPCTQFCASEPVASGACRHGKAGWRPRSRRQKQRL